MTATKPQMNFQQHVSEIEAVTENVRRLFEKWHDRVHVVRSSVATDGNRVILREVVAPVLVDFFYPNDRVTPTLCQIIERHRRGVKQVLFMDCESRGVFIFPFDSHLLHFRESDTFENLPELPGFSCPVSEFFRLPGDPS